MTLEDCLEKLREIGLEPELLDGPETPQSIGGIVRINTPLNSRLNLALWGLLNIKYGYDIQRDAYIPTKTYFRKYLGGDKNSQLPVSMETYDSMVKILDEEGFKFRYFTDVKEI